MSTRSAPRRAARFIVMALLLALAACGEDRAPQGPSPPGQQQPAPTVTAITPNNGATIGGVTVTITGTNFAAGATVTIGGSAATNVVVQSATTITATTPQHASGTADVVVTVNGQSGRLPAAFSFLAPSLAANAPPTISGVIAQAQRSGAPRGFADLADLVDLQATVQDAETPVSQLTFAWSAVSGTFEGTGAAVRWRAPAQFQTPATVRLTLTVTERYDGINGQGLPATLENRVAEGIDIRLHNSVKEITDLGTLFLVDFSQQVLSPETIVRNFTDSCRGKALELSDVQINQRDYLITDYTISPPQVTVAFDSVCPYFASRGRVGDGCAWFPVRWVNTLKSSGANLVAQGFDQVNAVYEDGQWRLCDSDFQGRSTVNGRPSAIQFKK
jgi:hypothetical protein